ncbi:hypothetical protein CRE_03272 [Caenorhabditis remanei]|uniref:alpha-1,2-Mannosidase n=1 Tax=Caenorhabditis remanei TaxID=31234 RepID=E3MMR0_CAERE|nr:hypothetical protein CRE_03272 [Caenorhabditis remanei]
MFNTRWKVLIFLTLCYYQKTYGEELDKKKLQKEAYDMFMHGYNSYMNYAFPADELMPLSCKGRIRGVTPSRGDVDDVLGNYSVTLLDSLDTLVVMNELDEFEKAIDLVIKHVRFDSDHVVSVFETNIRVLGGLISAHVLAELIKEKHPERLQTYDNQLLKMATEVGNRLLPAFNTTSGLPYSRINLKHGMQDHLKRQKDTCTACGGTMILEFAALTSLTGDPIYETKARKAMDFLWQQRHRSSDLMGTVLNVHSGDWTRRESGIGAGIDSYYEYTLKAYILLGDESYLDRFNKHYEAIKRYITKGPIFVDVHMHRPTVATRGFMDSLLAFWPGLQVLKGDVKEAIEIHEMLFQVIQKHKFLPEAFTHDFQVHWAEHPIRPEFVESTYFLYRATKDPHYLLVAKQIMDSINKYVKVPCGFAALKDIRTMVKEDQMESFVLSETFKYLYMIFTDPEDLVFDPDHYVLTTEAHFLPLSIGHKTKVEKTGNPRRMVLRADEQKQKNYVCANPIDFTKLPTEREEAKLIRERTKMVLGELRNGMSGGSGGSSAGTNCESPAERIRAWAFSSSNQEHVKQLAMMGIEIITLSDGRLHLSHKSNTALSPTYARWGYEFMQEMQDYVASFDKRGENWDHNEKYVQMLSAPYYGKPALFGSPAQFGIDLGITVPVLGRVAKAIPFRGCEPLLNTHEVVGRIVVVERSDCVFQDKARNIQRAGGIGMIVIDNELDTKFMKERPMFSMANDKDGKDDIGFASLFLFRLEGEKLLKAMKKDKDLVISMSSREISINETIGKLLRFGKMFHFDNDHPKCPLDDGDIILHSLAYPEVILNLRFNGINQDSDPRLHQEVVERHVTELQKYVSFADADYEFQFYEFFRTAAYGALNLNVENPKLLTVISALSTLKKQPIPPSVFARLPGTMTKVRCIPKGEDMSCVTLAL